MTTQSPTSAPPGGAIEPRPPAPASPLLELLRIAGPSVATMTSYTAMQFVDKLMVSRIGPEPVYVGAQGNGGLAAFVPISIVMGILTVINTYVAQNLGAGRPQRGPAYAWNGLWIGVLFWAALLVPYAFFLPRLFAWAHMDPHQAALADSYGRVLVLGSVLTICTRGISQYFYGMHRAWIVMFAGIAANVVNLGLNWALIFGRFGMPKLGITGSAIGTVIATGVELAIPMALFLGPRMNRLYATRAAWRPSWPHVRDLLRIGWPAGLMFGNEMVCWGYFMVYLVSQFGPNHASAGWIAHQYMQLSFMPAIGLSHACTALVGKYMGMGRPDLAERRAWLGLRVAMLYMGLCGVLFLSIPGPMIRLFMDPGTRPEVATELVRIGTPFLMATAAFQLFDAMAMVLSGSLRGAGDTVVPGVSTIVLAWTVIVGGGELMTRAFPGLGSLGPWIAAASYITVLSVVLLARFLQGRWRSIRLVYPAHPPAPPVECIVDGLGPAAELAPPPLMEPDRQDR